MIKYRVTLSIEEIIALENRLVPITPMDYDLKTYAILRNLYGRFVHIHLGFDMANKPAQAPHYVPDPRD